MGELEKRREKLFSLMKDNSVAVIFSGVSKIATEDELYPFTVNNSFCPAATRERSDSCRATSRAAFAPAFRLRGL